MVSKMEMLSKMDRNNSIKRKAKEIITTKEQSEIFETVTEALVPEVVELRKVRGGAVVTKGVVAVGVGKALEVRGQADAEGAEGATGNLGAGDGGRDGAGIGHHGSWQGQAGRWRG